MPGRDLASWLQASVPFWPPGVASPWEALSPLIFRQDLAPQGTAEILGTLQTCGQGGAPPRAGPGDPATTMQST